MTIRGYHVTENKKPVELIQGELTLKKSESVPFEKDDKITMDREEVIEEHEELTKKLRDDTDMLSAVATDLNEEEEKQSKELKGYKDTDKVDFEKSRGPWRKGKKNKIKETKRPVAYSATSNIDEMEEEGYSDILPVEGMDDLKFYREVAQYNDMNKSKGPWKKGTAPKELSAEEGFKQDQAMQKKEVMDKIKNSKKEFSPKEKEVMYKLGIDPEKATNKEIKVVKENVDITKALKLPIEKAYTKYPKYKEKRSTMGGKVEYIYEDKPGVVAFWKQQIVASNAIDTKIDKLKEKIEELKGQKDEVLAPVIDAFEELKNAKLLTIDAERKLVLYKIEKQTTEWRALYSDAYDRLNKKAKKAMDQLELDLTKINTYYKTKKIEKSGKDYAMLINDMKEQLEILKDYYKERLALANKSEKSTLKLPMEKSRTSGAKDKLPRAVAHEKKANELIARGDTKKGDKHRSLAEKLFTGHFGTQKSLKLPTLAKADGGGMGGGMSTAMGSGGDVTTVGMGSYPKTRKKAKKVNKSINKLKIEIMKAAKRKDTSLIKSLREQIKDKKALKELPIEKTKEKK